MPTFRNAEVLETVEAEEAVASRELVRTGVGRLGGGGRGGDAGSLYETGDLGRAKSNRRPGWVLLLLAVVALLGLVVGA